MILGGAYAIPYNNTQKSDSLLLQAKNFYGERLSKIHAGLSPEKVVFSKESLSFSEKFKEKDKKNTYMTAGFKMVPSLFASLTAGINPWAKNKKKDITKKKGWNYFVKQHRPSLFLSLIYYFSPPKSR